jgi:hypothetical protein
MAAILNFVGNEIWKAGCEVYLNLQAPRKFRVDSYNGLEIIFRRRKKWLLASILDFV